MQLNLPINLDTSTSTRNRNRKAARMNTKKIINALNTRKASGLIACRFVQGKDVCVTGCLVSEFLGSNEGKEWAAKNRVKNPDKYLVKRLRYYDSLPDHLSKALCSFYGMVPEQLERIQRYNDLADVKSKPSSDFREFFIPRDLARKISSLRKVYIKRKTTI